MTGTPLLSCEAVTASVGPSRAPVLDRVDLRIQDAEVVALVGPSGSGKTTLCHLVAGLGRPTSGRVLLSGRPAHTIDDWALVSLLPQRLALAEELTVWENIAAPALVRRNHRDANLGRARGLVDTLGLAPQALRMTGQNSLGEQQRIALARALVLAPALAVLDEPTGHQDDAHVQNVLSAIDRARLDGTAVLVATHDARVLEIADRTLPLTSGHTG